MKLLPKDFVEKYYPFAQKTQEKTGVSAIAILAQAALESGWGEKAPGNMFFGIKAKATDPPEKRQLVTTTEYLSSPDKHNLFPEVLSVKKVGRRRWKYRVKDWFRKYETPEGSFDDHALFFLKNKRYMEALQVGTDPVAFFREIAKAGYATSPIYFETLTKVARMIERHLPAAFTRRDVTAPPMEHTQDLPDIHQDELRSFVRNWPQRRSKPRIT
ncbi:MAG: peptidoglycan hydrolase [Bacteroidetes bacterium]|nr:MAG: peptidoglycan hydrolase [Bacteroidota bacterium]